jgi:DNA polymerase III alpha subunit
MKRSKHGEQIYNEEDLCNLIMQGVDPSRLTGIVVEPTVDLETAALMLEEIPTLIRYNEMADDISTEEFDHRNQCRWFMPDEYLNLDIAEHILNLCKSDIELQRCGQELMLFQERNLFNLLRYLKYLVDLMTEHKLIWGVGRGSSVSSYVLYKLGVHRIDSLFYELDPSEFLR